MQHRSARPGRGCRASGSPLPRGPADDAATVGSRSATDARSTLRRLARGASARVEYLIRPARITDIERLVALERRLGSGVRRAGPMDSGDLLRQLVYLPQASIFIAEARREVVGGAVLALRPSVRAGGFVGAVDLLVVDPDHDADRVTDALLEECLRSARNKGCSVVEAALPDDPAERTRLERHGFVEAGPRAECRWPRSGPPRAREQLIPATAGQRASRRRRIDQQGVKVGKNVAVFVDVANIFYAAKAAGVDIDYVTLLKAATRRARFRPRVRVHGARPGQREPAELPRLPARGTTTRSSARTSASTATARSRRTSTSSSSST